MFQTSTSTPHHLRVVVQPTSDQPLTDEGGQNWQIVQLLQRSRSADLYRARPALPYGGVACDYVLKRIRQPMASDPIVRRAFADEAQLGVQISHPHLVPVLGMQLQDERPFLIMPLLRGRSLAQVIEAVGPLPVPHALWLIRQVAEALQPIHAAGWIHGDLKPANIMADSSGHATLVDLGSVLRCDSRLPSWDRPLIGTLAYVAPEMLVPHGQIQPATDIYSLGATLYELLSGQKPFSAESAADLARAHLTSRPADVRTVAPQVPHEVSRLVHRMLAKDVFRRPADMSEVIQTLFQLEIETLSLRWTQPRPSH